MTNIYRIIGIIAFLLVTITTTAQLPQEIITDEYLSKENSFRKLMQERIEKRKAEITASNLDESTKKNMVTKAYWRHGDNEKIAKYLASYYAKLDYNHIDELNGKVNQLIEAGKIESADSILLSGNSNSLPKDQLTDSYLALCHIRTMQHQYDSAAYYLELRAKLNPANIDWQIDVSDFLCIFTKDYTKANDYANRALNQAILQYGKANEKVAQPYESIGSIAYNEEKYDKALKNHQYALEILKKTKGENNYSTARQYALIGSDYSAIGEYEKALEYHQKAQKILDSFGKDNLEMAAIYDEIGSDYYFEGEIDKVMEYSNNAIGIREKILGNNHPDVAKSYESLALIYKNMDDANSLIYYKKAIEINENAIDSINIDVARLYDNMGSASYKWEERLNFYEKALKIKGIVLGDEDLEIAESYENIAKVSADSIAIEYLNKSLKIKQKLLGEECLEIADLYEKIGEKIKISGPKTSTKYYKENFPYYLKALQIRAKLLDDDDNKAKIYNDIAYLYFMLGDKEARPKSAEYKLKAIEIYEKQYGLNSSTFLADQYSELGYYYAYIEKGPQNKTIEYYNKALKIKELESESYFYLICAYESSGNFSKELECIINSKYGKKIKIIGEAYSDIHDYESALNCFNIELKNLYEKGKESSVTYNYMDNEQEEIEKEAAEITEIYNLIGSAHYSLGNYHEALDYHTKALSIIEKYDELNVIKIKYLNCNLKKHTLEDNYISEYKDISYTYNSIGSDYSALGDSIKAEEYYLKALKCQQEALNIFILLSEREESNKKYIKDSSNIAYLYNSLGSDYANIKDYTKALEYHKDALEIQKKAYDKDDCSDYIETYDLIAFDYACMHDYNKALEYHNEAVTLLKTEYTEEYYKVADFYVFIASDYIGMNDYEKTLEYYNKAHNLYVQLFGETDFRAKELTEKIANIKQKEIEKIIIH